MSVGILKLGNQAVTGAGKLIGTSKNGIKVYEQLLGNGTRKLTSFTKDGSLFKEITTSSGQKYVYGNPIVRETSVINHITGQKTQINQARSKSKKYYNFDRTVTNVDGTSSTLSISSEIKNRFLNMFKIQSPKYETKVRYVEKLSNKHKNLNSTRVEMTNTGNRMIVENQTKNSIPIGNGVELPAKSTNFYKLENGKLVSDYYQNTLDANAVDSWTTNLQKAVKHNYFA